MKRLLVVIVCLSMFGLVLQAGERGDGLVKEQVLLYPSVDQFGQRITLSGRLTMPSMGTAKGMILLAHGTLTSNEEVPSNKAMYEERFFREEYVLVMPDYLGYGTTQDSLHPYLCGELTAQHCVDMLLAVRSLVDSLQISLLSDSLILIGYSQGAAVTLWTHKLLEEKYADRLPVKACFAGSGPYDVASEYDVCVQQNRTGMPVTIPMLTMGTSMGYQLHLRPEDFFTKATYRIYRKYVVRKKTGFVDVWFRTPNHKLSHWLSKSGRDKDQPATQRIYDGLLRSSLVHYPVDGHRVGQDSICRAWRPQAPTYIFHSTNDDVVGFHNSEHLQRCWGDWPTVTYEFGRFGGHLQSFYLFSGRVRELLD